jgi:hypothetical protein
MELLKKDFDIDIGEIHKIGACQYSERNRDCEYEDCVYFGKKE